MDPRLDRRPQFDPESRRFPIRSILRRDQLEGPVRSYSWHVPVVLDQGREGACVGFAWAHEVAARPWMDGAITDDYALAIYHWARQNDEWPGEDYDGTSVLAGAKAVSEWLRRVVEYRWAFGLDDLKRAVAYKGPAVLGINWYTGMFRPTSDGEIKPTGQIEGGHAILLPRVTGPRYVIKGMRNRNYLYNSWGQRDGWPWGWLGDDNLERLLNEQGEACIPILRKGAF